MSWKIFIFFLLKKSRDYVVAQMLALDIQGT